jgi:DNA-3-methyladenine glycosylase I
MQRNSKNKLVPLRCPWVDVNNSLYVEYHDKEWGRPVKKDDRLLFEMLILEGAQAGLSWVTVLKKRKNYKKAFDDFDPKKVARYTSAKIEKLLLNEGLIRNRLKMNAAVINAKAYLEIQKEFGSFSKYLWGFTQGKVIKKRPRNLKDFNARDELSDRISKDLKTRGFKFVGSTIIYAYLQAVGVIDEHAKGCYRS